MAGHKNLASFDNVCLGISNLYNVGSQTLSELMQVLFVSLESTSQTYSKILLVALTDIKSPKQWK